MDFTIEKIIVLNNKIENNKINKKQLIKYRNNNVIKLLNKRKKYLQNKVINIEDYKPLTLREKIIKKQQKQFKRDNINCKISDLIQANNYRLSYELYNRYYESYFSYLSYELVMINKIVTREDVYKNYIKYSSETYQYILDLLLISRNINIYQKRKNEKIIAFKLRIIDKLIDFMYSPTPNQSN